MFATTSTLKREHQDESSSSKRSKQEKTISSSISSILDIPDEILRKIILYLNARERLPLGNSCRTFKRLVFEDIELLRDLDFSKDVHLTSAADIQQYFNNRDTFQHILKLNMRNVTCMTPGRVLNNSLGKAVNLVDINIHGLQFKDIWQLGSFLSPLIHVQRLAIDWPEMTEINIPLCLHVLQKPFYRLVYLSAKIMVHLLKVFIPSLQLCHELRELRMVVENPSNHSTYNDIWGGETKELRNLEIVEYCGPFVIKIKELFVTMIQDPEKWTDFQFNSDEDPKSFHLEKNVEVHEELLASKWMERVSNPAWNHFNLGWILFPECLLKEVLKLNYQNLPEESCCLSTFMDAKRCLLKIEDAKRLLKNPRHQISYLFINHEIDLGCDVHLIASAFLNLTELVLCGITRNLESDHLRNCTQFQSRRKRRASAVLEEQYESLNLDSPFEMLVQNTPHLRHLTLNGAAGYKNWDLEELYFISSWKSLETLRLLSIPIEDGHFLIEIGKQCKHLQKLELFHLGPNNACCYKEQLLQMLPYCKNLRDFSIQEKAIGTTVHELCTCLAKNVQLRRVCAETLDVNQTVHNLMSSIKQLLHQCTNLTTFVCGIGYQTSDLSSAIQRLKNEVNRPGFQIRVFHLERYFGGAPCFA